MAGFVDLGWAVDGVLDAFPDEIEAAFEGGFYLSNCGVDGIVDGVKELDRPFSKDERAQLATGELRKNMRGRVVSTQTNGQFVHFDWIEGGILDVNLYDATADQISQLESLATADRDVVLQNCGLEYRPSPTDDRGETERVQLQVDAQTSIEPVD